MTKDNWIKAFVTLWIKYNGCTTPEDVPNNKREMDSYIAFISQVEKDAIEKRTKLLEDSFKHRTKPVINLDDKGKNCDICGYDHEYMVEDNENAYKAAHLKVELSQATEKTNKRWREGIDELSKKIAMTGADQITYRMALSDLSDLLEDK